MNRKTVAGEASVTLVCATFGLSRAAYYAEARRARGQTVQGRGAPKSNVTRLPKAPRHASAETLLVAIRAVLAREGCEAWGVRKVWATLRREDIRTSRRRVHALMRAHGLVLARDHEPGETPRGHVAVPEPNRRIATDLTTVWTRRDGTVALVPTIDCGDRTAVVVVTKDQHGPAVLSSVELKLREAFGVPANVPSDVELRTDHGPQYTGADCEDLCKLWNIDHTFAPVGRPTGNAVAAAAGDGAGVGAPSGTHAGLAPEAELVVVRALRRGTLGLADDDVLRGARFCADPRVSDPSRTVIVLALGGHDGPHDGTSAFERGLTAITRRGPAIVVAAGNDGARAIHASARTVVDEPVRLRLRVPAPTVDDGLVSVVLRGASAVRASPPGDDASPWVARDGRYDDGALRLEVGPDAAYVVWRGALRGGELAIEARGVGASGALDAWLVDARLGDPFLEPAFVGPHARVGETVAVPATADGVVAVGASVSRDFLPGEIGPGLTLAADETGRALFSAIGPRVDGAPLPTLLAPGGWVIAARSRDFDPADPEGMLGGSIVRFDAQRRGVDRIAVAGTSIAAAITAGAVALARAVAPGAHDEVALLAGSAEPTLADAAGPFDARRGGGLAWLPAYLARRADEAQPWDVLEGACTRAEVVPAARDVAFVARAPGAADGPFEVVLRASTGPRVLARGVLREGWASVPLALPPAPVGTVHELEVPGAPGAVCRLEVVLDEGVGDARLGGAGACAAQPVGRGRGAGLLVLVGLAVLAAWARRGG